MHRNYLSALLALSVGSLACRPVIAISWNEFLIVGFLAVALLGPAIYRFLRRLEKFRNRHDK